MPNKPAGDVHAPIEDTEVSLGLKVLVVIMFLILTGMTVTVALTLSQSGLLRLV